MSGESGSSGGDGSAPRPRLSELNLEEHLADPGIRQRFVTRMFDLVAPRYDRFTRLFSLGMDAGWKRELLSAVGAGVPPGGRILDLACGTGDLALGAARVVPGALVTGLDASLRMIEEAQARLARERRARDGTGGKGAARDATAGERVVRDATAGERGMTAEHASRVEYLVGDMMRLPVPDASFDAVTVGYGIRNVAEPERAIHEIARVLRPGGRVFVLDFYLPESRIWRAMFLAWLRAAGNVVGWVWHRDPVVYGYIAPSIARYVSAAELSRMLARSGFVPEAERPRLLGGIALHVARRSPAEGFAKRGYRAGGESRGSIERSPGDKLLGKRG